MKSRRKEKRKMDKNKKKIRIADLHTHTTASSSNLTPGELVKLAKKNGLYALAITDNDTLKGIKELMDAGENFGIELIPGVEMSVSSDPDMQILGLFVDPNNEELNRILDNTQDQKQRFLARAIKQLEKHEVRVDMAEIIKRKISSINELIDYLTEIKVFATASEGRAFFGRLYFEWKCELPSPQKCFETIHRADGLAILAYPLVLGLNDDDLKNLLLQLKKKGLDGIEVNHPGHSEEYKEMLVGYARELDLLVSGGSDFGRKPYIDELPVADIKTGVAYELVEEMKRQIAGYKNDMDAMRTFD